MANGIEIERDRFYYIRGLPGNLLNWVARVVCVDAARGDPVISLDDPDGRSWRRLIDGRTTSGMGGEDQYDLVAPVFVENDVWSNNGETFRMEKKFSNGRWECVINGDEYRIIHSEKWLYENCKKEAAGETG